MRCCVQVVKKYVMCVFYYCNILQRVSLVICDGSCFSQGHLISKCAASHAVCILFSGVAVTFTSGCSWLPSGDLLHSY